MASVITSDPVERTTLSTWRTMGAMLAGLVINVGGPLLIFVNNKIDPNRMLLAAIIFGILAISCYMACVKLSTERIVAPERPASAKGGMGKTVKGLFKNRPLITILFASLLFMMTMMLIGAVNVYLFKDYFQNAAALSIVGLIQTATVFLAIPLVQPLVKKFGKKETASAGMLLAALSYGVLYFLPNAGLTTFYWFSVRYVWLWILQLSGMGICNRCYRLS